MIGGRHAFEPSAQKPMSTADLEVVTTVTAEDLPHDGDVLTKAQALDNSLASQLKHYKTLCAKLQESVDEWSVRAQRAEEELAGKDKSKTTHTEFDPEAYIRKPTMTLYVAPRPATASTTVNIPVDRMAARKMVDRRLPSKSSLLQRVSRLCPPKNIAPFSEELVASRLNRGEYGEKLFLRGKMGLRDFILRSTVWNDERNYLVGHMEGYVPCAYYLAIDDNGKRVWVNDQDFEKMNHCIDLIYVTLRPLFDHLVSLINSDDIRTQQKARAAVATVRGMFIAMQNGTSTQRITLVRELMHDLKPYLCI